MSTRLAYLWILLVMLAPAILFAEPFSLKNSNYTGIMRKAKDPAVLKHRLNKAVQTATSPTEFQHFTVNLTNFSSEAASAFRAAVQIWDQLIETDVSINIQASLETLEEEDILGQCGPTEFIINPPGAPFANTAYAIPQAEMIYGRDINDPSEADFEAHFNNTVDWYYGLDGNPGSGQYDFITVVIHEMCHGLGYLQSIRPVSRDGFTYYGFYGYLPSYEDISDYYEVDEPTLFPFPYDHFIYNGSYNRLIDLTNRSTGWVLDLISDNIYWIGSNAGTIKLYAPATWESGSSLSHYDLSYLADNYPGMMYAYYIDVVHEVDDKVINQMKDMGWKFSAGATQLAKKESCMNIYPNPFNQSTSITIKPGENPAGCVTIYDIQGRRIRNWTLDTETGGNAHSFSWDGRDRNGTPAAAGIYLVRYDSDATETTQKITLLK